MNTNKTKTTETKITQSEKEKIIAEMNARLENSIKFYKPRKTPKHPTITDIIALKENPTIEDIKAINKEWEIRKVNIDSIPRSEDITFSAVMYKVIQRTGLSWTKIIKTAKQS